MFAAVLVGSACSTNGDADSNDAGSGDAPASDYLPGDDLAINEIQMLGSHNSYHLPAVDEVASALNGLVPAIWETISYEHRPIPEQLEDYGIRQFELDVFADPEGGRFANPGAYQLLGLDPPDVEAMSEPGFKVAHIADIDTNTTCITFVECLGQIEQWSSANPDHLPLMVMVETKGDDLRAGGSDLGIDVDTLGVEFSRPEEMTAELFEDLEAEVLSVFDRSDIITPDDVRGDSATLEQAVLDNGWPSIGDSRGKVLLSLVDTGESRELYAADAPSLEGRLFFTSSEPGRPDAAFLRIDNSLENQPALDDAARDGYLIRTRTDEPGIHAVGNDVTLRDSALVSGGHYLSTDYYVADPVTGFVVALPGGVVARCNPVTAPESCATVGEG